MILETFAPKRPSPRASNLYTLLRSRFTAPCARENGRRGEEAGDGDGRGRELYENGGRREGSHPSKQAIKDQVHGKEASPLFHRRIQATRTNDAIPHR